MKKSVFIRTDGNGQIGLGHLVRCFALASMLKVDFDVTFFCQSLPVSLINDFQENGFKIVIIKNETEFLNVIVSENIVVLDNYKLSSEYQRIIKLKGARLVCIDDLHNKEYFADLIINHTPDVSPNDYKAQPFTLFALGLNFALLRQAFLKQAVKVRRIKKIQTVLICFGGADPKGFTLRTLKIVSERKEFEKIIVITGAAFIQNDELTHFLKNENTVECRANLNEVQMCEAFLETELAIVSASGVLLEALAAGCIVITGITADNQKYLYDSYRRTGVIIDAGNFSKIKLKKAINVALLNSTEVKKVIDHRSSERLTKLFGQLANESSLILRLAIKGDIKLIYDWANNSKIRQYSFTHHKITISEHTNWFMKKINDPLCLYLVGEYQGIPVGSIRFDLNSETALISFLIAPEYHSRGLGQTLIKKGIERLMLERNTYGNIHNLVGEVMHSNIPSIKIFERMGFIRNDLSEKIRFQKKI